jgi:peptide/nickel transport system permease protein
MAYLPECWWMTVGPSVAIIIIILGFNFLGDGIRDMLSKGVSNYD